MLALYNTFAFVAKPFALAWAAWRGRDPRHARECAQRTTRELPEPLSRSIWLHGASVGEARVVTTLAASLRERFPDHPLALSAVTATGLAQLPDTGTRFLLPFDFSGYPRRLLKRLEPRLLMLIETELWPNLIHETAAAEVPLALVSARLAPERMARYRRWAALYRPLLQRFALIAAQSQEDAERFESLGAPAGAVCVTGNLKYDLRAPDIDRALFERRLGDLSRPIWVAGSTRPGEEEILLEAFATLRRSFPELLLVLAPRHLQRVHEVVELASSGWNVATWSTLGADSPAPRDVVVVDTLGQLAALYGIARIAFVGGTLKPFGGHSPLEPAVAGIPVHVGPHTEHFEEPVRELLAAGGARRVRDAVDLSAAASAWLADAGLRNLAGEAARETIRRHSGALERTLRAVAPLLSRGGA